MNYRYKIYADADLIIDKFEGELNLEHLFASIKRCSLDPDFKSGMNVVADMTETQPSFDAADVRGMAIKMELDEIISYGRIAIVTSKALQYGLFRMMGPVSEMFDVYREFQVFSSFEDAREWLGISKDINLKI